MAPRSVRRPVASHRGLLFCFFPLLLHALPARMGRLPLSAPAQCHCCRLQFLADVLLTPACSCGLLIAAPACSLLTPGRAWVFPLSGPLVPCASDEHVDHGVG